ncbi:MAG: hypothetical protein K0R38_4619 [Polyangiaceae bacterium]|jgi:serine/threonine-protein kinase|nr:hypothetical protein [Polyangiaceae bacterium]
MNLRLSAALGAFTLTSVVAGSAAAQTDANARALAVQLFDEAEALFSKGKVADACPKYAESYRVDPQIGVLVYLAECYEKNGQLASAWGSFREAEEMARRRGDPRADSARKQAAALEPRLSFLVVTVPESSRVPGLEVLRGGVPIPQVIWGSRAALDPGRYRIQARAPGYRPWQTDVVIEGVGAPAALSVPALVAEPKPAKPLSLGSEDVGSGASSRRIAAIAVGGVGLVGVGVGGFFGLSAQSDLSDSEPLCNEANFCTPRGAELREGVKSKALVATVATSVGAAALVTAVVLWFTAPSAQESRTAKSSSRWAVAPRREGWGMELTGAF